MLLPVLICCVLLLGPASSSIPPAAPAVESTPPQPTASTGTEAAETTSAETASGGTAPAETASGGTASVETAPAETAPAETASTKTASPGTVSAGTADSGRPMTEPQASHVTLGQVIAALSEFQRTTARAAIAEPLAELAKTLASVQESVTAMSGRLNLIHDTQLRQQKTQTDLAKRLDMIEQSQSATVRHVQGMERSQSQVLSRLDTIAQSQTEASGRLDTIQNSLSRLDGLQQSQTATYSQLAAVWGAQSDLSGALSVRLDAIEASQDSLSGRVDTVLQLLQQQQQQAAAAARPTAVQQQLDAIQAAINHIPQKVLGKVCSSDSDCSGIPSEAVCGSDGRCSCREGFRQVSETECRKPSRLAELCLEDADCKTLVSNTVCTRGECSCASGYWNHNNTECRQVSAVNKAGSCVGDQDCASKLHLRCVSGTCSCPVKAIGRYEYRLVGGSACSEGNVELRRDGGSWGVVCDDHWGTDYSGTNNANVICRYLGFRSGSPTMLSRYGRGTNFYMDNVQCGGSETHLMSCPYRGWGNHNCGRGEVAGARCR